MTKGIIVVDTPESCEMCEFMAYNQYGDRFCVVNNYDDIIEDGKPYWCPIQPLPEKINYKNRYEMAKELIAEGWNACIDKILGGIKNE